MKADQQKSTSFIWVSHTSRQDCSRDEISQSKVQEEGQDHSFWAEARAGKGPAGIYVKIVPVAVEATGV